MAISHVIRAAAGAVLGGAFLGIGALAGAADAGADPGGQAPVCQLQASGTTCDIPIQPDGTFKHCVSKPPVYGGFTVVEAPRTDCTIRTSDPYTVNEQP